MPGVAESSRALLKSLFEEDLIPVEALPHIIESYRRVVHDAHRRKGRANTQRADEIAASLQELLKLVGPKTGEENLRIIQAAVRYFVIQDDGAKHDLDSKDGLDDDARVVNTVLRYFGLDHLMIGDLPPLKNPPPPPPMRPGGPPAPRSRVPIPIGGAAAPPPGPPPRQAAAPAPRAQTPTRQPAPAPAARAGVAPRPGTPSRGSR